MMIKNLVLVLLSVTLSASEFPAEQECPEECDCHYFRVNYVTDCSESNLTEIPYEEISPNVYILDMNGEFMFPPLTSLQLGSLPVFRALVFGSR